MMDYGVDRAVVLTQRLDAMIDDCIVEGFYGSRVRNIVSADVIISLAMCLCYYFLSDFPSKTTFSVALASETL